MPRAQKYLSYLMIMAYDPGRKTLTVAPPETALGTQLRILRLTVHERMPPCLIRRPPGNSDCWLFIHFHSECEIDRGQGPELLPANSLVCWPPGAAHHLGHPQLSWDHSWCYAQGPALDAILAALGVAGLQVIALEDGALSERFFRDCHAELLRPQPDTAIVIALCTIWLHSCLRDAARSPAATRREQQLLRVREHIEAHLADSLPLARLAAIAGMSASHFSAAFRETFGQSPGAFLVERRLQQAAMLLQRDDAAINDIARRCGFADPFHFSRLFKRRHGLSPRAWRHQA